MMIDPILQASMLRLSERDRFFWGWWLARIRAKREQTIEQQAETIGLSLAGFAYLCLCRAPSAERRADDLVAVARATKLAFTVLEGLWAEAETLR
jgi:hypothetical protein